MTGAFWPGDWAGLALGWPGAAGSRLGVPPCGLLMLDDGVVVAGRCAQAAPGSPNRLPVASAARKIVENFMLKWAHTSPVIELWRKVSTYLCRSGESCSVAAHATEKQPQQLMTWTWGFDSPINHPHSPAPGNCSGLATTRWPHVAGRLCGPRPNRCGKLFRLHLFY